MGVSKLLVMEAFFSGVGMLFDSAIWTGVGLRKNFLKGLHVGSI